VNLNHYIQAPLTPQVVEVNGRTNSNAYVCLRVLLPERIERHWQLRTCEFLRDSNANLRARVSAAEFGAGFIPKCEDARSIAKEDFAFRRGSHTATMPGEQTLPNKIF